MEKRLQERYGMVLMCVWSIEWNWVAIYGKNGTKTHILGIFG